MRKDYRDPSRLPGTGGDETHARRGTALFGTSRPAPIKAVGRAADVQAVTEGTLTATAFTLALAFALAVYVAFQRERSLLRWLVLALLGSVIAWTAGIAIVQFGAGDVGIERVGVRTLYLGAMIAAPLWLFLSARLARKAPAIERPMASLAALFTPTTIVFVAMWTDASHGLFANATTAEQFVLPVADWAGPLFWLHAAWSYLCVIGGITCCLGATRGASSRLERRRLLLVAAAAAVPLVSVLFTVFEWVPNHVKLTPVDLGVTSLLLGTAVVRDRILETSPLAAREVIAELNDGLLLADEQTRIVDANPTALTLLGATMDEIRGRTLLEILSQLDPNAINDPELLCNMATGDGVATLNLLRQSDERVLEASCRYVESSSGANGFIGVIRDRTELYRRERTVHRSQRLESMGVLAAGIAHEINNPLTYVRTNLALIAETTDALKRLGPEMPDGISDDWAELPDVIHEAQSGLERIALIVASTRRLSRNESPETRSVDLHEVLDDVIRVAGLGADTPVRLESRRASELPRVVGSPESLAQVVLNLLINARQAAAPAGSVRIDTRTKDDGVELSVSDDGPGIPPAILDRVFDPFFTTKGPEEGTGLGLAISHEIAEAHGGSLEAATSDLGGACFRLWLPRSR